MEQPKMILFDYGQTLIDENKLWTFDGVRGTAAVLKYAVKNKYNLSAEDVQREADKINRERFNMEAELNHIRYIEVPNHMFTAYLYESLGIQLSLTSAQIDKVFWDAAAPGVPTDGIIEFLDFLNQRGIRTGVISNISFTGSVLEDRINTLLPDNRFEFIIATSEYMYRKPNKRIFDLALEKAELSAGEVWYIGDNYECDVKGAENAGIFPVWYLGAVKKEPCMHDNDTVLTIRRWNELADLLTEK